MRYFLPIVYFFLGLSAVAEQRPIVGLLEHVEIAAAGIIVQAKLDTGADESSLDAKNIQEFERSGKRWVKFDIRNRYGETRSLELPESHIARIKSAKGRAQERVVVRMSLCLADKLTEVDVNLVDRSNMSVPMLVGRGFLAGNVVIDPAKTYTVEPRCSGGKRPVDK